MTKLPSTETASKAAPDRRIDPDDRGVDRLLAVMAALRDKQNGCPWDLEQDFRTIAPHTIEEAYEVADAIEHGTQAEIRDEVGDLLFQVVYYTQMAQERGWWDFDAVARATADKMIARHPHVFGADQVETAAEMTERWEARKAAERATMAVANGRTPSVLDGIVTGLPGLARALKLQRRAARVGFDWAEPAPILDKIVEEVVELKEELVDGGSPDDSRRDRLEDEIGDILFAVVNLARRLEIDPDQALRRTNAKFDRRFRFIEQELEKQATSAADASLEEMERLWQQAKPAVG